MAWLDRLANVYSRKHTTYMVDRFEDFRNTALTGCLDTPTWRYDRHNRRTKRILYTLLPIRGTCMPSIEHSKL